MFDGSGVFLLNSLLKCLHRPQPYTSLKEVDVFQADEPAFGVESHTAPPSPISERFSNVTLLGGIFGCQEEPDNQPLTLTKSLEDLRMPKETEEPQVKLICQVRGLEVCCPRSRVDTPRGTDGGGGGQPGRIPAHRYCMLQPHQEVRAGGHGTHCLTHTQF